MVQLCKAFQHLCARLFPIRFRQKPGEYLAKKSYSCTVWSSLFALQHDPWPLQHSRCVYNMSKVARWTGPASPRVECFPAITFQGAPARTSQDHPGGAWTPLILVAGLCIPLALASQQGYSLHFCGQSSFSPSTACFLYERRTCSHSPCLKEAQQMPRFSPEGTRSLPALRHPGGMPLMRHFIFMHSFLI